MIEIKKIKHDAGYSFTISLENGSFHIIFSGNLDLYWYYKGTSNEMDNLNEKTFLITKENYFFYSLLEKLYEDIKNYNINSGYQFEFEKTNDTKINEFREKDRNNPHKLFHDGMIDWHSDDYAYEESACLEIKKIEEEFKISFKKGRDDVLDHTFFVRMRNSGSRYEYFNGLFMKMYHELIDYEPEYHQIHLEEYLYQMKLSRKKESQ